MEYDLAIKSAPSYGIKAEEARLYIDEIDNIVKNNWESLAKKQDISRNEIERMRIVFEK